MAQYLLRKHCRGGPASVVDTAPIDQWTPDEIDADVQFMRDFAALLRELSAAPGPGGRPIYEWLEVRPFLADSATVTE